MQPLQQMSEAETQVMQVLWEREEATTSAQVIQQLAASKDWKPSTVWTFLGRLVDKGLIKAEKVGKRSFYTPTLTEKEYRQMQTKQFLSSVHGGSVKSFFAALGGGESLSAADLKELTHWLQQETGGEEG